MKMEGQLCYRVTEAAQAEALEGRSGREQFCGDGQGGAGEGRSTEQSRNEPQGRAHWGEAAEEAGKRERPAPRCGPRTLFSR